MWTYNYSNELYHYGVLGMRWGVRRYQNKDGSLTKLGRQRIYEEAQNPKPPFDRKEARQYEKTHKNRQSVAERIGNEAYAAVQQQYKKYLKDHPRFESKYEDDAFQYWRRNVMDRDVDAAIRCIYVNKFVKEYAEATIKDLNIKLNKYDMGELQSRIYLNNKLFQHQVPTSDSYERGFKKLGIDGDDLKRWG